MDTRINLNMKKVLLVPLLLWVLAAPAVDCVQAQTAVPLPVTSATEIGHLGEDGYLPGKFEPSGAVWHKGRKSLIVVSDNGLVAELDSTGLVLGLWTLPGDLEAVTVCDSASSLVHIGVEHPDGIVAFDLATGKATGQKWDLTPWLKGPAKHGLEALTYGQGVFYAGLQEDGRIFTFNLLENGCVEFLGELANLQALKDVSGLHFDAVTGHLFAVHDRFDLMREIGAGGELVGSYQLPGDGQEGVAFGESNVEGKRFLFLSFDGGEVWSFTVAFAGSSGAE
jgi:hypothetical protein